MLLPIPETQTTACHHVPHKAREFITDTATVHVANIIANAMQVGSTGEKLVPPVSSKTWDTLNIEESNLEFILMETEKQFSVAIEFVLGANHES